MIRILYILFLSFSFSSFLELYGTGERFDLVSASGLGMGESYYFSDNINKINSTSISTYWKSNLTRISLSMLFASNLNGTSDKNINISSFLLTFPVAKYINLTFGLSPHTRSDIIVHEADVYTIGQTDFIDGPINSHSQYFIYGGISNLFAAYSMKLNKLVSFGMKLNNLFGNQMKLNRIIISDYTSTYQDSADYTFTDNDNNSILQIVFNQYSGYSIQFDWMFELNTHQFGASTAIMGPINILHRTYYNLVDPAEFLLFDSGSHLVQYNPYYSTDIDDDVDIQSFFTNFFNRINDYSIGYHYNLSHRGFILEYHRKNLFSNKSLQEDEISIFNNKQPEITSYHLGFYQTFLNSRIGFWNSFSARFGGYYKDINHEGLSSTDIAFTCGVGFSFNNNDFIVNLYGNNDIKTNITYQHSIENLFNAWKKDSKEFRAARKSYLLY